MSEIAEKLAELLPDRDAAWLRFKAKSLMQMAPEVLTMFLDGSATEQFETDALIPRISCPVLLLRGDSALGGSLTEEDTKHAVSLFQNCRLVSFQGVGHGIHDGQPERFCQVVTNFLESL